MQGTNLIHILDVDDVETTAFHKTIMIVVQVVDTLMQRDEDILGSNGAFLRYTLDVKTIF